MEYMVLGVAESSAIIGAIKTHRRDESAVGVVAPALVRSRVEDRDIVGLATTDDVDCVGDVVVPSGADLGYFVKNKAVFADHRYDISSWVGTVRHLAEWPGPGVLQRGWSIRVAIKRSPSPLVEDILTAAREIGVSFSIGFEPVEWGRPTAEEAKRWPGAENIIRRWNWRETSITAMPCNVSCRGAAVYAPEKGLGIAELVRKSRIHPQSARALAPYSAAFSRIEAHSRRIVLIDSPTGE